MGEYQQTIRKYSRGDAIPPQGVGGFDQNWYPICLSRDATYGRVFSTDFLDGQVIVVRGPEGKAQVLSPFCRHLGAHLKDADMVDGQIRCPFHHWLYDTGGQCVATATGDPAPGNARLLRFPTHEALGLIWAFNGERPLYDPPHLDMDEEDLEFETVFDHELACDHFIPYANSADISHLRAVHKIELTINPEEVTRHPHGFTYFQDMVVPGMPPMRQRVEVFGTNCLTFVSDLMGRKVYQLSAGKPLAGNRTLCSLTAATPKGSLQEAPAIAAALREGIAFGRKLFEEDDVVLRSISFRKDILVGTDRLLANYISYVQNYPRTDFASEMIT